MTGGVVEQGYEPVRAAFEAGAGTFGRGGGAFCAYVDGRPVVDLWGGTARPEQPWERSTRTVIMSATKGFVSLCVQLLADRGELDLDAPVVRYWPEFGQNGKERTLVRHVMLHTAGVLGFPGQRDLLRFDGTGWDDHDAIAAGFAAAAPEWEPGTRHAYHALSFGWLAGELVRRASGVTVGTFFRTEVAEPLGLEAWLGTPPEQLAAVALVHRPDLEHVPAFLRRAMTASENVARDPQSLTGKAFLGDGRTSLFDEQERIFNNPLVLRTEFPAGGATANARALARVWALQSMRGALDGVQLLSPESVEQWSRVETTTPDLLMAEVPLPRLLSANAAPVPRTLGYLGNGPLPGLGNRFGPHPDAYGAEGYGGQYGFADLQSRIAVGYVRSDLAMVDVLQPQLTQLVYACAAKLGHDVHVAPRRIRQRVAGALVRRTLAVRPAS